MELSSIYKLCTSIILVGSVIGCSEDNDESTSSHVSEEEVSACQTSATSIQSVSNEEVSTRVISANNSQDFNEGSDGDFYLASGEVSFLEDREYNFNNIYLESNSTLSISEQANTDSAFIKIYAQGSCDFNGEFNIEDYKGTLEVRCDGQFNSGGTLRISGSSVELRSSGILVTKTEANSEEEGSAGSGVVISNGDGLDGVGLAEIEGPVTIEWTSTEWSSIDFGELDFTITENTIAIDGGTIIFDPCNSDS